jgi:cell division septation protein DedD
MNPVFRRRLVGLIILLGVAFLLSWLLGEPGKNATTPEQRVALAGPPAATSAAAASSIQPATPAPDLTAAAAAAASSALRGRGKAPAAAPERALAHASPPPAEIDSMQEPDAAAGPPPPPPPPAHAKAPPKPRPAPALAATVAASTPLAAATPPSVSAPGGSGIWVQVGSFGQQVHAGQVLQVLKHAGYEGEVTQITSAGKHWFRVRLGPYAAAADAAAVRQHVMTQGYPTARIVNQP